MKHPSTRVRLAALAVAAALAALSSAASAGFMDDFYGSSGTYQGNLTQPGVIQSNTLNTITGGGFVYKTPRAQFTPFYMTPPSLKAGCGGIDLFGGAFSIPSQDEFLAFLRNIGQSLPGLAFELALQSLSPDLAQQVASYKNMLMDLSGKFSDACTAASNLLKLTGADQKIKETVEEAKNYGRSVGLFSDAGAANKAVGTDGKTAIDTVQPKYNALGELVDGPEMNIMWALLNSSSMSVATPRELKELMMSLVGTWVTRRANTNADQVLTFEAWPSLLDNFADLLGSVAQPGLDPTKVRLYSCAADTVACLTRSEVNPSDVSFAYRVFITAIDYRMSIVTRDPSRVNPTDLYMIATATSIPLLRIVNATAYNRFGGFSEDLIRVYSEAVAYEMLLNFIDQMATETNRVVSSGGDSALSALVREKANEILRQLDRIRSKARTESQRVYLKMNTSASFISQVEHIERSLRGNLAADLAANMSFSGRR